MVKAAADAPRAALELAIEIGHAQRAVRDRLGRRARTMLDVGCGRCRPSGFLADHVVGIDPDAGAIQANPCVDERIVGDIDDVEVTPAAWELVVVWNVLEHVRAPELFVRKLAPALAPGGLLVIALPNPNSVRGRITRHTPTWLHARILRHLLRGGPASPYPAVMDIGIATERLIPELVDMGLTCAYLSTYEGYHERRLRELRPMWGRAWRGLTLALERISGGRLEHGSDVIVVMQRPDDITEHSPALPAARAERKRQSSVLESVGIKSAKRQQARA